MPLPIRDGNQSLTTLSTLIVNSAHVPAHTVVSIGSQAITDIAQAVSGVELGPNTINALENISVTFGSGASVTIGNVVSVTGGLTNAELRASSVTIGGSVQVSNLPATQTVTFTQASVTFGQAVVSASNIGDILSGVGTDNTADTNTKFFKIGGHQDGSNQISHIVHVSAGGAMKVDASDSSVTFGAIQGTVTIGNSVTISNFPATQAVTFGQASVTFGSVTGSVSVLNFPSTQTIAGTVTANLGSPSQQELENITQEAQIISGKLNSVTIGSLPAISGTVTAYAVGRYAISGNTFQDKNIATDANGQTLINAIVNAQSVFSYDGQSHIFAKLTPNTTVTIGSLPAISGTVTANAGSGTFSVSNRGATGVATVTSITATTSVTLMASNSNRKLLTIYNEGAGNLHVLYGSGTATTANYSVKLFSGDYLEIDKYTGQVNSIFATAGTARVTEIT